MDNWLADLARKVMNRDNGPISLNLTSGKKAVGFSEPPFWSHPDRHLTLGLLPRSRVNYAQEVGDGLGSSVLMAPIAWIQRTFPEAPFELIDLGVEDEQDQVLAQHPMSRLMRRPNSYYTGSALWAATLYSWIVDGNGYWLKIRDQATRRVLAWNENITGNVVELWYCPHWLLEPKVRSGTNDFISYYQYTIGGQRFEVAPENVVHFRCGINPHNARLGLSQIHSELREIFIDDEAANFTATLLKNMGVPGLVLSPDFSAGMPATQLQANAEAVKAALEDKTTGDNRGKPLVMKGPTKVQQFGFNPAQMQVGNLRDISEERVCAKLGIPAAVVGFGTGLEQTKVGATMEAMIRLGWNGCLVPTQTSMAEQIQLSLLPDFEPEPELFLSRFNYSKVAALQDDRGSKATWVCQLVNAGVMRVDRAQFEMGIEVDPAQAIYLRNNLTTEFVADVPPDAQPIKRRKLRRLLKDATSREQQIIASSTPGTPTKEQSKLIAAFNREAVAGEADFEKSVQSFMDRMGAVLKTAAESVLNAKSAIEDESDAGKINDQIDFDELKNDLGQVLGAEYLRIATQTFGTIKTVTGLAVNLPDSVAREIVAAGGKRVGLVDLDRQTKDRLFKELADGRALGEGPAALVQRIQDFVPAGTWTTAQIRSRAIARTETLHAQRLSSLTAYRDAGNVDAIMVFDNRTGFDDEECSALDGVIVTIDEAWSLMDDEHPNGTRSFAPVVNSAADSESDSE